ncbi:AAA family ATPase [Leifsonia naganoensis]|uniref:Putative kinase n=1 Tax=Leifsonia naganoensis TaxID=150025 RepID=A0A853DNM2_9MICO|nr:AAA family ATPase [Leifsonia naganoensis]NYK09867.1 putative kinase [Leifsonia naganoensis]
MADRALLINGAPASGKTTLARRLCDELGLPLVTKDDIKEALADAVPVPLPTSRVGAIASDAMWQLVGLIDGTVIVESFWFSGRDGEYLRSGLDTAGIASGVELWCEASAEIARERYLTRPRHPAHDDAQRLDEWELFHRDAQPVSGFPVLRVDTEYPVDIESVARRVRALLNP